MDINIKEKNLLGINSLGRIGKLSVWYHLMSRKFDGIVINVGREVGQTLEDFIHTLCYDSTYGPLRFFMNGRCGEDLKIETPDRENLVFSINGFPIKVLISDRNPQDINWKKEGVRLVVDCTGKFLDPTQPADNPKGSLKGHLVAGAQKVICSAPFKIKGTEPNANELYPTLIYGINHECYDPLRHNIVSAASCTTTGLAHMLKPLLEDEETHNILTASLSTVHAATNTQSILDSVPKAAASDLRKNRSVFNNIILSSTGAAKTLEKVIPEITKFGFMADSIRIPTTTVSLIALNITFNSRLNPEGLPYISGDYLRNIYQRAAMGEQKNLLFYSGKQNVSTDLLGMPAAIVIEGKEIHTRTGFMHVSKDILAAAGVNHNTEINLPVTHAKIMGWYDNEFGSYTNCLGRLTEHIASHIE